MKGVREENEEVTSGSLRKTLRGKNKGGDFYYILPVQCVLLTFFSVKPQKSAINFSLLNSTL